MRSGIDQELHILTASYGARSGLWTVAPQFLSEKSIVYSVGVGNNIAWDLELIARHQVELHAFDPTPRTVEWLATQDLPTGFHFHPIGLSDHDGTKTFLVPKRAHKFNYRAAKTTPVGRESIACEVRRLSTLLREANHQQIDVLKIDIEGEEMRALPDMIHSGIRPGQLLVEFHYQYPEIDFSEFCSLIHDLRQIGYRIFDISARGYEFSLIHERLLADSASGGQDVV